jgi:FixJ family two-component response regulator
MTFPFGTDGPLSGKRCRFSISLPGTGQLPDTPVISVVDDDDSVRTATTCLMRSLGYVAYGFASAEEFLSSPHLPDTTCLITDVQMPGISGIELERTLIERGYHIPVILISAFPEERLKARAISPTATSFLRKPFDSKALVECLDAALRGTEDMDS